MTEKEMFREYRKTRDIELRNRLVEDHLYMVDILIKKYLGKGVERDDLYQVGAMALISAVDRFDPEKGFEFSSFATPTIIGEIKKYFRDKGWSMKVPRRLKEISVAIPGARERLSARLGRTPTVKEIADYMGLQEDDILQAMESSLAYGTYSLNQTFDDDSEDSGHARFEKYASKEERGYDSLEDREIIENVLDKLSDTHKYIFKKRFIEEKSQAEIAKDLGVSQMTVSRAEKTIRDKFRAEFAK
ncbi:MAG: SigB/SigF/SigG family RNA polymerase sigma factor [Anaerovoracaceae bacterium]|jgi:RNA polymerase sigma-B factor